MKTLFLNFLTFFFALVSCNEDAEVDSNLYQTWEAKDFMSVESVAYPRNDNTKVLLTFTKSGTYQLKLDINGCGGAFTSGEGNKLDIKPAACTEICCDSKFSEKLAGMLAKVTSYHIEGKTLKLNVPQWGYIELELDE
jgi:heat shock protein HslJ